MAYIEEGLKHQFAKNIELVIQEQGKLRKYVTEESQETEVAYFETMKTISAYPRDRTAVVGVGGYGAYADPAGNPAIADIQVNFPEVTRRQLNCQAWAWSAMMDRNDQINLLADPTSKFPKMAGIAMARAMDQQIIKAIGSSVMSGLVGTGQIHFDIANNVVPLGLLTNNAVAVGFHNDNASQAFQITIGGGNDAVSEVNKKKAGLTIEKLIMARQMLNRGTFNSDEKMYFVCSEQQLTDLLQDPKVTSSDYNTVRALVNGELKTYMGFEFIKSELLTGIAPPRALVDAVTVGSHSIRECFAFVESSIRFATVKGSEITKSEELFTKHSARALYHSISFGAARSNEGGVVIVKCLEPTQRDHVALNGWIQPEASADNGDQRLARLTRASVVPSQAIIWTGASYANANALAGLTDANTQDLLLGIAKKS